MAKKTLHISAILMGHSWDHIILKTYHLVTVFNIAMENGPFIDGLPIKKW